ncbi:MAG: 23S rRNA (pseudouridine(1915)-N(3))-methyltransferase RlmH [Deltaproteobacteria bacterium]|nr:23S rRNA (pseudouridine(1915)-N(3))-methyltransferase RlmH [Deltaproteobacteria bacterium]
MKILLIAVGRVKERGLRDAVSDYIARIGRYGPVEEIELKDAPEAELTQRFERRIPARSRVVAMEVEGRMLSSKGLASYVGRARDDGVPSLVFLIGGAYGLPRAVRARADLELSLSKMTLPHRLARLFLAEQVYRAFSILRGEPYSH